MKLRQIVIDKTDLTLVKEKEIKVYGEEFDVSDARGKEILAATYKGAPVAEVVDKEPKARSKRIDLVDACIGVHVAYMKFKEEIDVMVEMENYLSAMGWKEESVSSVLSYIYLYCKMEIIVI